VVAWFLDKRLALNPCFAHPLLTGRRFRFSFTSGTRIDDEDARPFLAE